jgi:hypothetical protein
VAARAREDVIICHSPAACPPSLASASYDGYVSAEAQSAKAEKAEPGIRNHGIREKPRVMLMTLVIMIPGSRLSAHPAITER